MDVPGEALDVVLLDMPAVLAEVDGDDLRPAEVGFVGGKEGVWLVAEAGLPEGGYVVDVDAKEDGHRRKYCPAGHDRRPVRAYTLHRTEVPTAGPP